MSSSQSDRNVLFGVLALQMEFITQSGLIAALQAWTLQKLRPLGELLVELGHMSPEDRAGSLAAVAVLLSLVLLGLIAEVGEVVGSMRRDEQALHEGLMLGVAVREQYIHEAHTLIESTDTHLDHHDTWVEEVARSAASLQERVPQSERWRVRRITETSTAIDRAFRDEVVPAMRSGDLARLRTEHHRIDALAFTG